MARSLNRATLIGNLGRDPELRTTPGGISVCTISVATTDSFKNKNNEWQESTDWHSVVLWEGLAERAHKFLKKGSKVYIEGKIKTRSYEKDGITKFVTEIRATNLILMGERVGNETGERFHSDSESVSYEDGSMNADDDEVPF